MPDEPLPQGPAPAGDAPTRRIPLVGVVLAAAAALLFVGGTLLSVLSAEDAEIEGEKPRPALSELMADSQLVVEGTALSITRLGEPRDAAVVAKVNVEEVVASPGTDAPTEVVIFDRGFRENWIEGQRMLLFLGAEGTLPAGAEFQVRERCVLEEEALPCPYDVAEVERLADDE